MLINRLLHFYKFLINCGYSRLNKKENNYIIYDLCDTHPLYLSRVLSAIRSEEKNIYFFTYSFDFRVFIQGYRTIPHAFIESIFFLLLRIKGFKVIYTEKSKKFNSKSSLLNHLYSQNKDLIIDGILRSEKQTSIRKVSYYRLNKHLRYYVGISNILDEKLNHKNFSFSISGHKTYYFRGLLYRKSALLDKGYYIGPRENKFIIKKLTPANFNDCCMNKSDLMISNANTNTTLNQEKWITDINKNNIKITNSESSKFIFYSHVFADDNFKGSYNLFGTHFNAVVEIISFFERNKIPLILKFHPHNKSYGLLEIEKFISKIIDTTQFVSLYNKNIINSNDFVITGHGNIIFESFINNTKVLNYSDHPFKYLTSDLVTSKADFFKRILNRKHILFDENFNFKNDMFINNDLNIDFSWLSGNKVPKTFLNNINTSIYKKNIYENINK